MADITFTFTNANLTEVKAALKHHKGVSATQTNTDIKTWMTAHVDAMVRKYRTKVRNDDNAVSTTSTVS